jgi:hypothetical protein
MKILRGVRTKVFAGEFACAPSLVKGMIEKLMAGDTRFQRALKNLKIHSISPHLYIRALPEIRMLVGEPTL